MKSALLIGIARTSLGSCLTWEPLSSAFLLVNNCLSDKMKTKLKRSPEILLPGCAKAMGSLWTGNNWSYALTGGGTSCIESLASGSIQAHVLKTNLAMLLSLLRYTKKEPSKSISYEVFLLPGNLPSTKWISMSLTLNYTNNQIKISSSS